jgi:crotonobetainyl-CoA:carnitine CoA-transferase CaiB-like acyl-CoA transferase
MPARHGDHSDKVFASSTRNTPSSAPRKRWGSPVTEHLHRQDYTPEAEAPLAGIRVVDMSRLVAGNMVTHMLADFGADVVKIEDPVRGDDLRNWKVEGIATYWKVYARNKRSLTLDYRAPKGRELLAALLGTAHVVVENFVPGRLEKYGLGPDWLHDINDRLIIVRVSGWGQSGPYAHKPGFGSLVEAMSGFAAMNGFSDRPPILPPLALADMVSGLYGASATMIALRHIEVGGGKGQVIDLSLFEPMLAVLGPQAANHALTGMVAPRFGSRSPTAAPRNVYECSDGKFVALSASMQSMAEKLFQTMGRPDLIADPRYATNTDRVRNDDALDPIVADFMRQRTQAENLALFDEAGVTVGPVCDASDLVAHPYIQGRQSLVELPDDEMGQLPMHNVTPRLSGTPGQLRRPAPKLGEHTAELLTELGIDAERQAQLKAGGVI